MIHLITILWANGMLIPEGGTLPTILQIIQYLASTAFITLPECNVIKLPYHITIMKFSYITVT